jgi:hypothetical protein
MDGPSIAESGDGWTIHTGARWVFRAGHGLGLVLTGRPVLTSIARTFAGDFGTGKHWS